VTLTASGAATGYRWYDAAVGGNLVGTGSTFITPSVSLNTSYYAASLDGTCEGITRSKSDVTILPPSIAGTLTPSTSQVCVDGNAGTVTLSGYSDVIIDWLYSTDNFNTPGLSLGNTSAVQNFNNLTTSTSYKAIVQKGTCPYDTSAAASITVNPITIPGTLSLTTITEDGGTLTLSNYTGSITRWEVSADTFATAPIIINNTSPTYDFLFGSSSLSYRVIVQSGGCLEMASDTFYVDQLVVYTSLTPNSDGINDVWIIKNIEKYSENFVTIFDRWGNLVFKVANYDNVNRVWKGSANAGLSSGSGTLPDGTYYYQIDLGNNITRRGFVVIKK
jgi:gliding motility-associated-like protein